MKRLTIVILLILLFFIAGCGIMNNDMTVQEKVEEEYTNQEGLIHAYPNKIESQYLAESIGLYLEYLLLVEDGEEFSKQVNLLREYFITSSKGNSFITWEVTEDTEVNALIDDVRIIHVLLEASDTFNEKAYMLLAEELKAGIRNKQINDGVFVDYYDWKYDLAADRITLSYMLPDFFQLYPESDVNKEILNDAATMDSIFYPEYYNVSEKQYENADKAHMVDQLLIAHNLGYQDAEFENWIVQEWENKGHLYGQYDKKTMEPIVDYESLSVYYYLYVYFTDTNHTELAEQVFERALELTGNSSESHFFDFIHLELMRIKAES